MKYYESTLRLRIPSTDLYGIHQHLDFFIQEQSKAKLPYSFLVQPGTGNDSRILLRTAQPIGVPGEKHLSATFTEGQKITLCGSMAVVRRETVNGRKREVTPPHHELNEFIHYRLELAGFTPHHVGVYETKKNIIQKPDHRHQKGHRIVVPTTEFIATGNVASVEEFEQAFVFGVGRKRIFGVGQISLIS